MIKKLKNIDHLDDFHPIIGKQLSLKSRIQNRKFGSNNYSLKKIESTNIQNPLPSENSRCNFEKFESGLLLRINDNQDYYGIPINVDLNPSIRLIKGTERIKLLGIARLIKFFGGKLDPIRKRRFFKFGLYNDNFHIDLKIVDLRLSLESNSHNFESEKAFFKDSILSDNLIIEEKRNTIE